MSLIDDSASEERSVKKSVRKFRKWVLTHNNPEPMGPDSYLALLQLYVEDITYVMFAYECGKSPLPVDDDHYDAAYPEGKGGAKAAYRPPGGSKKLVGSSVT